MRTTARMYELTAPSEALPGATGYPSGYRVPLWVQGTPLGTGYPSGYRVPLGVQGTPLGTGYPSGCFHGARVRGHVRYEPLRIRRPHGMHPDLLYACVCVCSAIRVLPVVVGGAPNHHAMTMIARASGGRAEAVSNAKPFSLQAAVARQIARVASPAVERIRVAWRARGGVPPRQAPQLVPAVFRGDRAVVYAMLEYARARANARAFTHARTHARKHAHEHTRRYCDFAELSGTVCGSDVSSAVYTSELHFTKGRIVHRRAGTPRVCVLAL